MTLTKWPLALILVTALASCRSRPAARNALDLLATEIDTSMSLETWIGAHPGDAIVADAPPETKRNGVCRAAIAEENHGDVTLRRAALFDAPAPPANFALDADTTRFAQRYCKLRWIALIVGTRDPKRATSVVDSLAGVISARSGGSLHAPVITQLKNVLVAAPRDTALLDGASELAANASLSFDRRLALLDSTLGWADVLATAPLRAEIARRLANHKLFYDSGLVVHDVAIPALRALMAAAPALPPARRSAALLAADLIIEFNAPVFRPGNDSVSRTADSLRRAPFEAAGAKYGNNEPDATLDYMHNVEWDAYRADSLSPAGRSAFRSMLSDGWKVEPRSTPGNGECFRSVIAHGEQALRDQSADTVMLHHVLAEAYGDVYSLAHGGGDDMVDSAKYQADAPDARRRAIEHARIALATLRTPAERAAMWRLAFRLIVGAHRDTRFLCIND